jgi:hypothetical protein
MWFNNLVASFGSSLLPSRCTLCGHIFIAFSRRATAIQPNFVLESPANFASTDR